MEKKRMLKVYCAGKLNDMAVEYLYNVHKMMTTAEELRGAGYAVFIPCIDLFMGIMFGYREYDNYFDNSQPWLESADAVFLVPGWETSKGAREEMKLAWKKDIPIFSDLEGMDDYFIRGNHARKIVAFGLEPGTDEYGDHMVLDRNYGELV